MTTVNELAVRTVSAELLEQVVIQGDLAQLTASQRLEYYRRVCESLGLNPLTKPFGYITFQGKLRLYALKDATEQLAQIHGVSLKLGEGRAIEGIYIVHATASTANRSVDATGAVNIEGLTGENKANAFLKAETKACRRAVLRLVGLGWLDETEVEAVPGSAQVDVDPETGEIVESPGKPDRAPPAKPQPAGKRGMCETHGKQFAPSQGGRIGHPLEGGGWCWQDEATAPKVPPSDPETSSAPVQIGSAQKGAVEGLREHLEALGWGWEGFQEHVLNASWEDFVQAGGTPAIAWKRFENYQEQQADAS